MKSVKYIFNYLLISIVWVAILYSIYWIKDTNKYIQVSLPESTTHFIQINTKRIIKSTLLDIWFRNKDVEIINSIHALLLRKDDTQAIPQVNFKLTKPVYYLKCTYENSDVYLLKGTPENTERIKYPENFYLSKTNDLYQIIRSTKSKINYAELKNKLFDKMVKYTLENNEIALYGIKNRQIISTYTPELSGNKILLYLRGNQVSNRKVLMQNQSGVHLTINTDFFKLFNSNSTKFISNIEGISINYYGADYNGDNELLAVSPKFDLILNYKKEDSISSVLNIVRNELTKDVQLYQNRITLFNNNYYFHQINKNTIFISTKPYKQHKIINSKDGFIIMGKPKNLTQVRNLGWRASFLSMIPTYHSIDHFVNTIEGIDFQSSNNISTITLSFSNDLIPRIEILRLILALNS